MTNNACFFDVDIAELKVSFQKIPTIEEELIINFFLNNNRAEITQAWVEGQNMYMGKTPVIFESKELPLEHQGITFLGSCSQPQMQWQFNVAVKNKKTEQTKVYSAFFTTHNH